MTFARPIEIVGGGLAGLALAGALRRAGAAVTVFEAGSYPRHRVCGEFIAGLSPRTIDRLGLEPALRPARRLSTTAWFIAGRPARRRRLPADALAISRHALDASLAEAFLAAGGDLRTGIRVDDSGQPPPGRIFATGRRRGSSSWLGLKAHVGGLSLAADLELHLGDEAYVGLSSVEDGSVNLCGLFRRRPAEGRGPRLIAGYLEASGLGDLARRLRQAEIDPASFCSVAAVAFDPRVRAQGRVCLGDACALIPPFTGNGMAMAFQSAEAALDPLLAYARERIGWPEARLGIEKALRKKFALRLASAGALHPYMLVPSRQRWLAALDRAGLIPFRTLYTLLH